jgi:hypothetical protein
VKHRRRSWRVAQAAIHPVAIAPSPPLIKQQSLFPFTVIAQPTHTHISSTMAPDENDPRRNRDRSDEHNPFIAFRRFADSQVSSLMNTVFTLPATIANYKNVHTAREQCLFGRADKAKCHDLHELEEETARVVAECRELYRAGNVEQALDKGEVAAQLRRR